MSYITLFFLVCIRLFKDLTSIYVFGDFITYFSIIQLQKYKMHETLHNFFFLIHEGKS